VEDRAGAIPTAIVEWQEIVRILMAAGCAFWTFRRFNDTNHRVGSMPRDIVLLARAGGGDAHMFAEMI